MKSLDIDEVIDYVKDNIDAFHQKRIDKLNSLRLRTILERKNPYLFKAKNVLSAETLTKGLLDAYLSSQEETIFGEFLEGLAIFVCSKIFSGRKSAREGIDLEFERDEVYYIVEIKSGPHWGNSSQIKRMRGNFDRAIENLLSDNPTMCIVAVNGCCYGRDNRPDKNGYLKYCGQRFWSLISGDANLYLQIVEPLGHQAKQRNDHFQEMYYQIVNKLTFEIGRDFCTDGRINWDALVKLSSAIEKPLKK